MSIMRHTSVCPMREVVTRAFRKSGSSTRAGGRQFLIIASRGEERSFLIIASLRHSTKSAWVDVLIRTVCPLPRHGRFPSALPAVSTPTGASAQPPTDIRLRFADAFASASKVCLSLAMCPGFLPALPRNVFYEDHAMLVVILGTSRQSFPCQLLFQCWDPYVILH